MELDIQDVNQVAVVRVQGAVDSASASRLQDALRALVSERRYNIVLDLSGCEFLSSAAVRVLINIHRILRQWERGDLRLAAVPAHIRHILSLTGLDTVFEIFESPAQAIASF